MPGAETVSKKKSDFFANGELFFLDLLSHRRPPTNLPRANAPPDNIEPYLDYSDCQLPPSYDYLYVDEQYSEGHSA